MERMLVVVFHSEGEAYEGARALRQLDFEGSIAVNTMAIVHKDLDGGISLRDAEEPGPVGTVVGTVAGTAIGALIGALGGPAGAVAGGAAAGGLVGGAVDLGNAGAKFDELDEVSQTLLPGTTAVVADVIEEWVDPVDVRMASLGGVVFRRDWFDVEETQFERDVAAVNAEMDAIELERANAREEAKAKLNAKIEELKAKRQAAIDRAKAKIESIRQEGQAKVKALQDKAARAKADLKQKQEERAHNLRVAYERRVRELQDFFGG